MSNYDFTLKHLKLSSGEEFGFYSLAALESETGSLSRFPFSIKILLESLLRMQGHPAYSPEHVASFAQWPPKEDRREEYPFLPARILLQDFTGVPAVVDIAALRSALKRNGLEPGKIEPQIPVDLIIDHSVQTDRPARKTLWSTTWKRSSNATASAIASCAGDKTPSTHSGCCHPVLGYATR